MTKIAHRRLGAPGIIVPPMGIGTLSWGDRRFGYGKTHTREDLFATYKVCLDAGLNYFDTSENYGNGRAEQLLGEFQAADGRPIIVATKFSPANVFEPSDRFSPKSVMPTLDGSLKRLNRRYVDLYQLHTPPPRRKLDAFLEAMAETVKTGKARAVGVSNFDVQLLRYAHAFFAKHGIPLASNEIGYNLLYRYHETDGVLETCEQLDIALVAYLPLSEGVLTGKYRVGGEPYPFILRVLFRISQINDPARKAATPSFKRWFARAHELDREKLEPLFVVMERIAKAHDATLAQVALNWLLASSPNVIPIPGPKNDWQARDNIRTLSWQLSRQEFEQISQAEAAAR